MTQNNANNYGALWTAKITGVLISIWQGLNIAGIINAVVCTAVGTIVSFLITRALKTVFRNDKDRNEQEL